MYEPNQLQEVFARIEQGPGWIGEVTQQLEGPTHLSAMYVLCRQPARLDEALQERCWTAVGAATVDLDQLFQKEGHVTTSEALKLVDAVKGVAELPGPVRHRHRAEFLAAVEYLNRARADTSQIPDMGRLDWAGKWESGGGPHRRWTGDELGADALHHSGRVPLSRPLSALVEPPARRGQAAARIPRRGDIRPALRP